MTEQEAVPISALQHWCFCPRQCALIHQEQAFAENAYTLRGRALHGKVDKPGFETRAGFRVERALPIWSEQIGLIGKADVVEFSADGSAYPVEYKQGSRNKAPRIAACDDLQLAAQAMCLEEMTGKPVPEGALFYASSKRRREVGITADLRAAVVKAVAAVRGMIATEKMPAPAADSRCGKCSLVDLCQPFAIATLNSRDCSLHALLYDPDG